MIRSTGIVILTCWIVCALVTISPVLSAGDKPVWWDRAEKIALRSGYRLIMPDVLEALYDSEKDFLVLDVRTKYEYIAGHLPGAAHMEFGLSDRSQITAQKKKRFVELLGPDKNRFIVIYCRNYL